MRRFAAATLAVLFGLILTMYAVWASVGGGRV